MLSYMLSLTQKANATISRIWLLLAFEKKYLVLSCVKNTF